MQLGLIAEEKLPPDNRVALTPAHCKWLVKNIPNLTIVVEASSTRCFTNEEYTRAGIPIVTRLINCNYILGIKEVPYHKLLPNVTYLFFSHTIKKQAYNKKLLQTVLQQKITLVDYECLKHADGQRILGFGFFAGVVGAHNGIMAYGIRTGAYSLPRVYQQKDLQSLMHNYFGLKIPAIKIAITGSGRVAHGVLEVMNLMGIIEVEPEDYLSTAYNYPVYTQIKGADLYQQTATGTYSRKHFHANPSQYHCLFANYLQSTHILMNGVYWDENTPRLFTKEQIQHPSCTLETIADITDDEGGSVPINLGDQTIENPTYGVCKTTFAKTQPYLPNSIDVMAVGNLPNELPRDASRYFGEQLIKHILQPLFDGNSEIITQATIATNGTLTAPYHYLQQWVSS